ncbi:glycoside hydrolase family 5 protein [Neorhodopirellula pilleata]|nr:glycoside hydrolase family 5 protein [Neorhodopirellula pilleata]
MCTSTRHVTRIFFLVALVVGTGASPTCLASPGRINLLDPGSISPDDVEAIRSDIRLTGLDEPELLVKTRADEDYPGIAISAPAGGWNLTDTPIVEMTVRNLSDHSIDVLLTLANPGSDGRNGNSAEKLHVPEGESATLRLIVGVWYGSESRTFDPSQVARLSVIVDRSSRSHSFSILNIHATSPDEEIKPILQSDYFAQLKPFFGKGLNIGNTLDAPNEGEWGGTIHDEQLKLIRQTGFDSIRLPVNWSAHASNRPPYRIDASFKKRVKHVVNEAMKQGLRVVLNVHHYDEIFEKPRTQRERFLELWRQIASDYADYPPELAFEILNEPHAKLDSDFWNELLLDSVELIRQTNPDRWIVIGPVDWNSVRGLPALKLPQNDARIALTVHYYSPMEVTHQGAPWLDASAKKWIGTTWTNTLVERTRVQMDFNEALTYGYEHKVPIYLGEFGTYQDAPFDSRVNWTRAVVEEARRRKMGYAYWEFYSNFGLYDPEKKAWREPLKKAVLSP